MNLLKDSVRWFDHHGTEHVSLVHEAHSDGSITVTAPAGYGRPVVQVEAEQILEFLPASEAKFLCEG